jgi:outer membrane protein assembly factor BamB
LERPRFYHLTDPASKGLLGLCLRATDGKILWQKRLGDDVKAPRNNGATPSAVTDGRLVFFLFGSGDLAALDYAGEVLWTRSLIKEFGSLSIKFGYSSSPQLWNDRLYVLLLRRPKPYGDTGAEGKPLESFLLAVDPTTGKDVWRQVRPSEAVDESSESYGTPIPFVGPSRSEILVQGGDCVSGHDPATGKEWWRLEYNPDRKTIWRIIPSPVPGPDRIFVAKPRGGPVLGINSGGTGGLGQDAIAWMFNERSTDSGTPLLYQGSLYILQSDKSDPWTRGSKSSPGIFLIQLDPATGKESGRTQVAENGAWRASPTGADGKIYCLSEESEVVVLSAGKEGRILSRKSFDDGPTCATIAAANGRLFIRTASKLTCLEKPRTPTPEPR